MESQEKDEQFELYKMSMLVKKLSNMRTGTQGTSAITLLLPPTEQIPKIQSMIIDEIGSASNIKSRVNRQSVISALTSAQNRLKLYRFVPKNGLILLCGIVEIPQPDGTVKEKKISFGFEPPKPLTRFIYKCDNKFHLDSVEDCLTGEEDRYGILVITGEGAIYAYLTGTRKETLFSFEVDLPKKHGRGGQSALRFSRLAEESRHNYLRKVGEFATKYFIDSDKNIPLIKGLIIGGSGNLKFKFIDTFLNDKLKKPILLGTTDTSYGFEQGISEVLSANKELLKDVRYVKEREILSQFYELISKNVNKYCYGFKDTMKALDEGYLDTLLISEKCPIMIKPEQMDAIILERLKEADEFIESSEGIPLPEYLIHATKGKGTKLILISDASSEGSQFLRAFGGIAGFLRYERNLDDYYDEKEQIDDESNDKEKSEEDLSEYF